MPSHATQEERILALLSANFGRDVPLPDILSLRIAQYNARIKGLRRKGYDIRSRTEWNGADRHTWFRLVGLPSSGPHREEQPTGVADTPTPGPASRQVAPENRAAPKPQKGKTRGAARDALSAPPLTSCTPPTKEKPQGSLFCAPSGGGCIYTPCKCRL